MAASAPVMVVKSSFACALIQGAIVQQILSVQPALWKLKSSSAWFVCYDSTKHFLLAAYYAQRSATLFPFPEFGRILSSVM